ncbi:PAS-domain containing protein [Bowmanella sp. Y26]|uniref:hybrid sensor histidine kinase/response regulator n=1 Tax=Bowmanella yangjiangensis TaxID=2811230 RepID=UPI001BDD314C|nr:PAS domain-containing hybrid sensor histidine kinase/response regulator [Bowmanella yangjiangensis]MBT1065227.1 PAS-domain containing protein [Bowmanella yangjiangensis]
MFSIWLLTLLAIVYLSLLFAVGFWGDRFHGAASHKQRPLIYSLALGVHCTSWAFFGTTAQSATYGWAFTPTYVGSVVAFALGYPLLVRIIRWCQQHNISSLADFIGSQYKHSHFVAAFVTLICFIGVVPYTALQLDAVTTSVSLLATDQTQWPGGISFYVALLMAIFAILFGTRSLSLTEKHPGLMLTIAFESLVKMLALVLVGLFVCYQMFDGVLDLLGQVQLNPQTRPILTGQDSAPLVYLCHMLLGFLSMFCLPRQFHVNYIENNGELELKRSRWLFPLYLLAINLFVLPIALAGKLLLPDTNADTYVLALPMLADSSWSALVAFIGGLSAASSMIIVATLAMGVMMANNLITPLWLKLHFRADQQQVLRPSVLLGIRRLTVILVIGLSYLYSQYLSQAAPLVNSGIIAMALLAQLAPAMLFALYWQRSSRLAAVAGILAGCSGWVVWLLWPSIKASYYFESVPSDHDMSLGVIFSLSINLVVFVLMNLLRGRFKQPSAERATQQSVPTIRISTLLAVSQKILSEKQQTRLQNSIMDSDQQAYASGQLIRRVERELAAQVGNAGARILLSALTEQHSVPLEELVGLVEEASQNYQFNHELLQSSVEHIEQGISVVDRHLKLLAWNSRYISMFNYPEGFIRAGLPLEELLRFNARRGMLGDISDIDTEVVKRLNHIRQGSSYKYLRSQPDGRVIELQGNPMPGGGFVTTYADITEHVQTQRALEDAKQSLELRVAERTEQLQQAKLAADRANDSKTKFLAAAGHDLMQPFNAATLFAGMIAQQSRATPLEELASGLQQSLNNAEELLSMLLDMTRLDSGILKVNRQSFALSEILDPLMAEFSLIAGQKQLDLHYQPTRLFVSSDKKLLRRVIQNLVSNAVRYTEHGKVVVGVRRRQGKLLLQVWDTGPGIAKAQQQEIFDEFHQLQKSNKQGLGLGLTIVERISKLLGHNLILNSVLGKGSCFAVEIEQATSAHRKQITPVAEVTDNAQWLSGKSVLLVDNEKQVLTAMSQLFEQWGAQVTTASNGSQALQQMPNAPDLLLMDYHLDHGAIGTDLAQQLYHQWRGKIPTILNSANHDEIIRSQAIEAGFSFLHKPVKAGALKRLIKQIL